MLCIVLAYHSIIFKIKHSQHSVKTLSIHDVIMLGKTSQICYIHVCIDKLICKSALHNVYYATLKQYNRCI